jgi:hypothetical protein
MLEFLWSSASKAAPPVPPTTVQTAPAEANEQRAADWEKTAPPPESNPQPVSEQPQAADSPMAASGPPGSSPDQPPGDRPPSTEAVIEPIDAEPAPDTADGLADLPPGLVTDADAGLRRYQRRPAPGRRLVKKDSPAPPPLTAEQRLLLLDTWRRSGLPAGDFAAMVGVSKHTLYAGPPGAGALGSAPRPRPPGQPSAGAAVA